MVFQVRDDVDPKENFMRNWEDYKVGFGDFDREFWLGNHFAGIIYALIYIGRISVEWLYFILRQYIVVSTDK